MHMNGAGPINNFKIRLEIYPSGEFSENRCSTDAQSVIGELVNNVLKDFGMGNSGKGDHAVFSAEVCTKPLLKRRRLSRLFSWAGRGICVSCSADNGDGRRLENDNEWFKKVFIPKIRNRLEKGIDKAILHEFDDCVGTSPRVSLELEQTESLPDITCA
jgi:hypothetical protein